jgi:hypothetical protein
MLFQKKRIINRIYFTQIRNHQETSLYSPDDALIKKSVPSYCVEYNIVGIPGCTGASSKAPN